MTKMLYYYTPPDHVLRNLRDRYVKVSSFGKCNDPFELAAFSLSKGARYEARREFRSRIHAWQRRQERTHGLICFSKTWRSPVMWAHYADNHAGLCLEFEIKKNGIRDANHVLLDVDYTPRRIRQDSVPLDLDHITATKQLQKLCATKFSHWRYEDETRLLVDLRDPRILHRCGMHFMPLDECMQLTKIYMGFDTRHPLESIEDALGAYRIPIVQTRRAFTEFKIVQQENRRYWKTRETM